MRLLSIFIVIIFGSCGIVATNKRNALIESKGLDPRRDTSIVRSYQYYIKHKGFVPIYRELTPLNKLDQKINIKGFENEDSIPIERVFENLAIVVDDTTLTVNYGELHFSRAGYGGVLKFGKDFPDTCLCKSSFNWFKPKQRVKRKGDLLFFWNVSVIKDGVTYTIPARFYNIQ